jgi:hypothetical protein
VIDDRFAAVTVSRVVLEIPPVAAVMVVFCPAVVEVANPEALMVAAAVFEEDHVTEDVRSCVLLSEKVPVAWN